MVRASLCDTCEWCTGGPCEVGSSLSVGGRGGASDRDRCAVCVCLRDRFPDARLTRAGVGTPRPVGLDRYPLLIYFDSRVRVWRSVWTSQIADDGKTP